VPLIIGENDHVDLVCFCFHYLIHSLESNTWNQKLHAMEKYNQPK